MHRAILDHNLDALAQLLVAGGDPNDIHGNFALLHDAVGEIGDGGDIEAVALLLRHGADPNIWTSDHGATPLLTALFCEQDDAVLMLLAAGADPNVRSDEGDIPLCICVKRGHRKMVATLLRAGATKTIEECAGDGAGMDALGHAAYRLDIEIIKLLLAWGASLTNRDVDRRIPRDCLPPRTEENAQTWDLAFELLSPQA
jgi:uncharacterized protein